MPGATLAVTLNSAALTAGITLHFPWPIGNLGGRASFRVWRSEPSFLVSWKYGWFGKDKNQVAVSTSGRLDVWLAWGEWHGEWPLDMRVEGLALLEAAPEIAEAVEEMPVLELVRRWLHHDWRAPPPLEDQDYPAMMKTASRYQFSFHAEPLGSGPGADRALRAVIQRSTEEADFFSDLQEKVMAASGSVTDRAMMDIQGARAELTTTTETIKAGKITLAVELLHLGQPRVVSDVFELDDLPGYARRFAAALALDKTAKDISGSGTF